MIYVYGCNQDPAHPRREVVHSMMQNPEVRCNACGDVMHRIPQPFRFYQNPQVLLLDKMDERYREIKKRKQNARKNKSRIRA